MPIVLQEALRNEEIEAKIEDIDLQLERSCLMSIQHAFPFIPHLTSSRRSFGSLKPHVAHGPTIQYPTRVPS